MTAEQLIDNCYEKQKPYPYAIIWKLHTGEEYSVLSKEHKKHWRWAVRDRAEKLYPLPNFDEYKIK